MPTVVLVRHGTTRLTGPVLAGWTPGLHLDARGERAAVALAGRLAEVCFAALVSSPLDRCLDTVAAVAQAQAGRRPAGPEVTVDARLGEVDYGEWTGRPLGPLRRTALWRVLGTAPSTAVFPGGEAMRDAQHRAVAAVREWDARLGQAHGPDVVWLACSHGDIIKSVVADALGLHLDHVHRLLVEPCSVTAIRYTAARPVLLRLNDQGGRYDDLVPPVRSRRRPGLAVGGSA